MIQLLDKCLRNNKIASLSAFIGLILPSICSNGGVQIARPIHIYIQKSLIFKIFFHFYSPLWESCLAENKQPQPTTHMVNMMALFHHRRSISMHFLLELKQEMFSFNDGKRQRGHIGRASSTWVLQQQNREKN